MNLCHIAKKFFGWCPRIEDAKFFRGQKVIIPVGFTASLILFVIITTVGLQNVISSYNYWFNIVPQREVPPIIASIWRMLSDLLYCLGAMGLTGLAAVVFRSETVSRREMKILAAIMLSFGSSKLISSIYYDIIAIMSMGPRFFDQADFTTLVQYLWVVLYFFIAYRIIAKKPVFAKSTFALSSILCVSLIIRSASGFQQILPFIEPDSHYYITISVIGLEILFLVAMLWSLVKGYRSEWLLQTLISDGYTRYLRIGILSYGLKVLVPMLLLPFVYSDHYLEEILRSPVFVLSFIVEVLFGLSIILASIYPLKLDLKRDEPSRAPREYLRSL